MASVRVRARPTPWDRGRRNAPLARPEEGAQRWCATDERRSPQGWIGGRIQGVVLARALRLLVWTVAATAACAALSAPSATSRNPPPHPGQVPDLPTAAPGDDEHLDEGSDETEGVSPTSP